MADDFSVLLLLCLHNFPLRPHNSGISGVRSYKRAHAPNLESNSRIGTPKDPTDSSISAGELAQSCPRRSGTTNLYRVADGYGFITPAKRRYGFFAPENISEISCFRSMAIQREKGIDFESHIARLARSHVVREHMSAIGPSTRRTLVNRLAAVLLWSSLSLPRLAYAAVPKLVLPKLKQGQRRLYLVRHGETDWNVQGRIQGRTDNPLNNNGLSQAAALGRFLADVQLDLVASSTLERAAVTADAVALFHPSARRVKDARFVEMSFGDLEGRRLTERDVMSRYTVTVASWAAGRTSAAWPNGESCDEVAERGLAGLRSLGVLPGSLSAEDCCPRHVLVAAHGRFNKILLASLRGDRSACSRIAQGNSCLNVVDVALDGKCTIVALDVRDHLKSEAAAAAEKDEVVL